MPRGRPKQRVIEVIEAPSASSAIVEKILTSLKPDREITASEFLKRAFQFPQIDKIKVQKFSAGTWNFAEDLGNLGGEVDPNTIEQYLTEKYGRWRFRLLAVCQGEVITQHLINIDGWQETEARSAASTGTSSGRPVIGVNAKPVGPGATGELLAAAKERVEIENTARLLATLGNAGGGTPVAPQFDMAGPMKMFMEMTVSMMATMKEAIAISRGQTGSDDPFMQYLREEVRFLREQAAKPAAARDPDALSKTIDTIDGLLQRTLNTSLAEMMTGVEKTEASGWAATIQGIIEGVKPFLPDLMGMIQAGASRQPALPFPTGPARVIPMRPSHLPQTAEAVPSSQPEGGDSPMPVNPMFAEVIELLITALKEHDFDTLDTLLTNPPLLGQININPKAKAKVYIVAWSGIDPRFKTLESEIEAYLKHMRDEIAKQESEEQDH